jgi:hypothetical protein
MPDLAINFEFLCAFVPPAPFSGGPKSCYVVLPDFKAPPKTHLPVLLYDRQNRTPDQILVSTGLNPKEPGQRSPNLQDAWDKLDLGGEELEIQPDGKPLVGPDSLVTSSNLDALLRIADAGVGMEVFDENLLTSATTKVVCRLHLRQGALSSAEETSDEFGVYNLKDKDHLLIHSQRMARRVVFTIGFTKFIDLVFRNLGSAAERRLRLTNNTGITVTIRNCEPGLVWDHSLPPYKDQFNDEINLFFTLSRDYKQNTPPQAILLKRLADGLSGICAPKVFDSFA